MEDDSYDMDLGVAPRTAIFELNFPHAPCFGKQGERGAFLSGAPTTQAHRISIIPQLQQFVNRQNE